VALLVALLIIVPIVELAVILQVGQWLGVWETLALLLAISVAGAWLVKGQGLAVLRRIRMETAMGRLPGRSVVDGALVLVAGILMLTPGFVTDALGLVLLVPATRVPLREAMLRRWSRRFAVRRIG
jgi:UPF0716 protein FxsA